MRSLLKSGSLGVAVVLAAAVLASSQVTIAPGPYITDDGTARGPVLVTDRLYVRDEFDQGYFIHQDDLTAKSLADAEINIVHGSPLGLITYREELAKTASSWVVATGTLDLSADDTIDNEGVEIVFNWGGTATTEGVIIAGTSGACLSASLTVTLIAGTDQLVMGWRQNEAFQDLAAYAGYTVWNAVGITNVDGSVFSLQEVSEATDTDDSGTNWADGETHTLRSCISAAGVPTASLDDVAITMTETGSTLTAGTQLLPFLSYLQAGGLVDAGVFVNWVQIGPPR